jgi:hypothetical protein
LVNYFRVDWIDCLYVCRVCFDCESHQRCTVGIYCASVASKWPCFQRKKCVFFSIFFAKKNSSRQPLTSAWRHLSYVSSTSPDNWRQSLTTKFTRSSTCLLQWMLHLDLFVCFVSCFLNAGAYRTFRSPLCLRCHCWGNGVCSSPHTYVSLFFNLFS